MHEHAHRSFIIYYCAHACMGACVRAYLHTCIHACVRTFIHAVAYVNSSMHSCNRASMHSCTACARCLHPLRRRRVSRPRTRRQDLRMEDGMADLKMATIATSVVASAQGPNTSPYPTYFMLRISRNRFVATPVLAQPWLCRQTIA